MVRFTCALLLALTCTASFAQSDWFPPFVRANAAAAMLQRFDEVGVQLEGSPDQRQQQAQSMLQQLADRLDEWGTEGIYSHAPSLPDAGLPSFDDPILSAITAYGACSLPLHPELVTTTNEKTFVVVGETAVGIVSAFLRNEYLNAGGTDPQLKDALDTAEMNQAALKIQVEEPLRNYVAAQCGPTFEALLAQ